MTLNQILNIEQAVSQLNSLYGRGAFMRVHWGDKHTSRYVFERRVPTSQNGGFRETRFMRVQSLPSGKVRVQALGHSRTV